MLTNVGQLLQEVATRKLGLMAPNKDSCQEGVQRPLHIDLTCTLQLKCTNCLEVTLLKIKLNFKLQLYFHQKSHSHQDETKK